MINDDDDDDDITLPIIEVELTIKLDDVAVVGVFGSGETLNPKRP